MIDPAIMGALVLVLVGLVSVLGVRHENRAAEREALVQIEQRAYEDMLETLHRENNFLARKNATLTGQTRAVEQIVFSHPSQPARTRYDEGNYPVPSKPARSLEDQIFHDTWVVSTEDLITQIDRELEEST